MRLWPRSLGGRLAVAFGLAVVAVVALSLLVEAFDDGPAPTLRGAPAAADGPARAAAVDASAPVVRPRADRDLGFAPRPVAGTIALAGRLDALSPDIAPVVEVLADGGWVLRRPPPLAAGPEGPGTSRWGDGAGVVLPAADLDAIPPAARAGLVALLGRWVAARPVPAGRLRTVGWSADPVALTRLLSWVP